MTTNKNSYIQLLEKVATAARQANLANMASSPPGFLALHRELADALDELDRHGPPEEPHELYPVWNRDACDL